MSEKSLLEKLGIRKNSKVALISPSLKAGDPDYGHLGITATPQGLGNLTGPKLDVLLVWVETRVNLIALLKDLKTYIKPDGSIWTVIKKKSAYPKESLPTVSEMDIIEAAKGAGLVDNKIASLSDTEYAFKLVIPVTARGEA